MELIDIGANLGHESFDHDLDAVLARARAAGISQMLVTGASREGSPKALALAQAHPGFLYATAGVHPHHALEVTTEGMAELRALHAHPEVRAVGECGLDFALENPDRELQEAVCRSQLRLAREHNRPLSIHCRRAWERLAVLAREEGLPEAGAVVHAFSGSAEVARELQSLGLHLSFSCSLANPGNSRGAKAVTAVSDDRLLFETDAPDLLPRHLPGFKAGAPNEPANLHLVAEAAARLRGTDLHSTAAWAYKNSERIFGGLRP